MKTRSRPLRQVFADLKAKAEKSGADQALDLERGARIAVRVQGGQIAVTFSRPRAPLGEEELSTFIRHCEVPATAKRIPANGQATREEAGGQRWYVGFKWTEEPSAQEELL